MRKQIEAVLTVFLTAALLSACASGLTFETDYDRSLDFSGYKTFGFFTPLSIEKGSYSTLIGNQFRESIGRQMRAKGYVESDNPDLTFNVSANFQEKTKITQTQDPMMAGGYYGYRRGYYDPWGGYGYGTTTHVSQYTEGTINVDMVDLRLKRMVWEGIAFGRLKEDRTNEERRLAIEEGVKVLFEGYPYNASQ